MARATTILLLLFVALANADRDWSKIRSFAYSADGSRIVGGKEVTPNSIPYQVALFMTTPQGTLFCGGSLISEKYVLTAAHCVDKATQIEVVVGAHNITKSEPTQQIQTSVNFKHHENWDPKKLVHDIAVIELPEAFALNANVGLVKLPKRSQQDESFVLKKVRVSGWGRTSIISSKISDVLKSMKSSVMSNFLCNIPNLGSIETTHICALGSLLKSPCNGDSGGPLVLDDNTQVGITSFIVLGCRSGAPPVYTRVSKYLDWLALNTDAVIN